MNRSVLKKSLCALAMVGACATANATTTDLGPIGLGAPTPFSGQVFTAGAFIDNFTFSLPANGGSGYSVINFPLALPGGLGTFDTVFSSMVLTSNPDGIVGNADDSVVNSVVSAGGANALSFTFGPTAGGNMYLSVLGITNGTLNAGLYNGAISVTAVPEPSTWAMLGLGMGMVGFALRRKMR